MQISWNFLPLYGFWLFGIVLLFLWLKNRNSKTEFRDVWSSLLLGAVVGFLAAFAADKLNLHHFMFWIAYVAAGAYLTYRLLNKQYTTKSMYWIVPLSMMFTGCGKFSDGTSVWSEGLWIIPTLTFIGGLIFLYFGYRASRSGSERYEKVNGVDKLVSSDENVPLHKTGQFVFAVILFLATIGIIIWQNLEK
ncbi:MAG: hypothetical protein J0M30_14870 [Chitinophagales bacterium]|nr:hypothetical protein [Chitinophagales bacterium]